MEIKTLLLIISALISLGALIVSIVAICQTNKREKSRKLKDIIIEEFAGLQHEILSYLTPIANREGKYSCQETISWFKFTVQKIEAICAYSTEQITIEKTDLVAISDSVQQLRTYLTEAQSFGKAYNDPTYTLEKEEILEVEKLYADVYKSFLSSIAKVNNAKRR